MMDCCVEDWRFKSDKINLLWGECCVKLGGGGECAMIINSCLYFFLHILMCFNNECEVLINFLTSVSLISAVTTLICTVTFVMFVSKVSDNLLCAELSGYCISTKLQLLFFYMSIKITVIIFMRCVVKSSMVLMNIELQLLFLYVAKLCWYRKHRVLIIVSMQYTVRTYC